MVSLQFSGFVQLSCILLGLLLPPSVTAQSTEFPEKEATLEQLRALFANQEASNGYEYRYLHDNWTDAYIPPLLDVLYLAGANINRRAIVNLLEKQTGQQLGADVHAWYNWLWQREQRVLPYYGDWMADVYRRIDPKFAGYFKGRTQQSLIRLDEVKWGGVRQDGIPPLRQPEMISASRAKYLRDSDIVFGISINGDHRAYPKRILAWHEMFVDEVGGESIAGVYCTLCGTVIAYNTCFAGVNYELGTSGFLYRSNKLMYDKATQSLWNTIEGKPVLGPLINQGIELSSHSVVTTTWGGWRRLHPESKVLSLNTGHKRDYGEGVAYRDYFATDELMFRVPTLDNRLNNKDEVLIVRAPDYKRDPLAISARFLARNKVYHDRIGAVDFVVLTDRSGVNRVYATAGVQFKKLKGNIATDETGIEWRVSEDQLLAANGQSLQRLPYHRIFWFAWFNSYPNTRLRSL